MQDWFSLDVLLATTGYTLQAFELLLKALTLVLLFLGIVGSVLTLTLLQKTILCESMSNMKHSNYFLLPHLLEPSPSAF